MNTTWIDAAALQNFFTEENVIFPAKNLEELSMREIEELGAFHAQAVKMVELNDDYLCGIRANHFVVEIGTSEYDDYNEAGESSHVYCLISANHKGVRLMTFFRIAKELVTQA